MNDKENNADEWGDPVPVTVRREVTLSVRFSAEEVAAIRERAAAAGMKPTAYIRQAAIAAEQDRSLVDAVERLMADAERVRKLARGQAA